MKVVLELQDQPANVRRVTVRHDIVIGRGADCNLRLSAPQISRRHCFLRVGRDGVSVTDLDSSNGTFVDGKRIKGGTRFPLSHGSELSLGPIRFRIHIRDEPGSDGAAEKTASASPKGLRQAGDSSTVVADAQVIFGTSVEAPAERMKLSVEQTGAAAESHDSTARFASPKASASSTGDLPERLDSASEIVDLGRKIAAMHAEQDLNDLFESAPDGTAGSAVAEDPPTAAGDQLLRADAESNRQSAVAPETSSAPSSPMTLSAIFGSQVFQVLGDPTAGSEQESPANLLTDDISESDLPHHTMVHGDIEPEDESPDENLPDSLAQESPGSTTGPEPLPADFFDFLEDPPEGSEAVEAEAYETNEELAEAEVELVDDVELVEEVNVVDEVDFVEDPELVDNVEIVEEVELVDETESVDEMEIIEGEEAASTEAAAPQSWFPDTDNNEHNDDNDDDDDIDRELKRFLRGS